MALPGLPGLPPVNASSSATSALTQNGNAWDFGQGDWIVNMGGSGTTIQNAAGGGAGGSSMLLWGIAAGIAWLIFK